MTVTFVFHKWVRMTENNGLPHGWVLATIPGLIGEDGVFSDGDWVESKDQDPDGNVRLIQLADIGDGFYRDRSNRFLTKEKAIELNCTFLEIGDVLIARMPDPLGRACLFPGDIKESVTVVDVCVVRTGSSNVNHKWLMYFVNTPQVRRAIESLQSGTTRKRISRKNLAKIEFPVPSIPEQERIVAKIEELFTQLEAGVAELQQARALLQRYRQAVLKSAVEGELTREWREAHQSELEPAETLLARILSERRAKWEEGQKTGDGRRKKKYKEPVPPDTDSLPELPEGWAWANFDQLLLRLKNGFFGGRPATEPPGVPLLRISAVRPMSVSYDSLRYIREISEEKLNNYQIEWGDLLFTRYNGNPNLVGACGMVRQVSEPTLYPDKLIRALVPKHLIKPDYLEIYFSTSVARGFINRKIKSTAGQNGIAGGDLKVIPVIIPPLEEQQQIIAKVERRLSVADEIEKELDQALARSERLRQSILKSAFEGKLVGYPHPNPLPTGEGVSAPC